MNYKTLILLFSLFVFATMNGQTTDNQSISEEDLRVHIEYLASDELEGRESGTQGNEKAAEYIADQFRQYGLRPAGDNGSYLQKFEFVSAVSLGDKNRLEFTMGGVRVAAIADKDFRPLGFSTNTSVSTSVVFAGYGISAPDQQYDDYAGLDVNGKTVIVLRHSPDGNNPHAKFNRQSSLREKARTARDKGAVAIILVTGPADEAEDDLIKLTYDQSFTSSGIAAICIKRSVLDGWLVLMGQTTKLLQDSINSSKRPLPFPLVGINIQMETEVVKITDTTANIVGLLEGTGSASPKEVIVLGAHMDHLGYCGPGSGALDPDEHAIHNGADDNASGTAALLELAQAFASAKDKLNRSLLFIAFSGEEMGTLGSAYYVAHPTFALSNTVAMLNMDMVGRLEKQSLTVQGIGTSPAWEGLVRAHNQGLKQDSFHVKLVSDGFGPSDHAQFYGKDIPVLFFFTGTHNDYHKISDDWEKINFNGEKRITEFVYSIALDVSNQPDRLVFSKSQTASPMSGGGDSRNFTVTLGIIPDYGDDSKGMKVGGIRPNGPAEKAGIKAGDLILKMAGKQVLNIYDYMGILGELKVGDKVDVEVQRDEQLLKVAVIMEKRQ